LSHSSEATKERQGEAVI